VNLSPLDWFVVVLSLLSWLLFLLSVFIFIYSLIFGESLSKPGSLATIKGCLVWMLVCSAITYYGLNWFKISWVLVANVNIGLGVILFLYLTFGTIRQSKMDFWERVLGFTYCSIGLVASIVWFFQPSQFANASTLFGLLTLCMMWLRW
jgi:hypothetical protein